MKGKIAVGFIAGFLILSSFFVPARVVAGNQPDAGHSTISGTEVPADGSTASKLTVSLQDSSGTALSSDNITLSSTDTTTRFNTQTTLTTDLDGGGTVHVDMTSTSVGGVNVTVTDNTSGGTITGSVTFDQPGSGTPTPTPTPGSGAGTCTDSSPGGTPQLTSVDSAGTHSITLVWTDVSNPVTNYVVSYGLAAGKYIYGNPNVGGQGTTSYTVGGLNTGTRYYFAVMANNGCTAGSYSNEMSEAAGGAPTPTPEPVVDTPTDTPDMSADTPALTADTPTDIPTPTEAPSAASGGNSFVSHLMIGVTAVGVVCAGIGIFVFLKMKKKRSL